MTDIEADIDETPPKKSKLQMVIALVLALIGGAGSFYAVYSGLILGSDQKPEMAQDQDHPEPLGDIAFVPVEQLIVPVGFGTARQNLVFRAQLEVKSAYQADVELLLPRIIDVMNSYLRALEVSDLESPTALVRIRSQILRRLQLVTGEGRVNDLLIMEFVLN